MTRRRPLPEVPADLWDKPDMSEALDARDMTVVLRIYQRWTGATQPQIATACGIAQPSVSAIMSGKRKVAALDMFERFAEGLDIPRRRLGLADRPEDSAPAGPDRRAVLVAAGAAMVDPVASTAKESADFLERYGSARVDPLVVEQFADDARRLAVGYLGAPPETVVTETAAIRHRVFDAIEAGCRPEQLRDLHLIGGVLSGVLAYAAMDLDKTGPAMANARATLLCADLAGHHELAVWARGTQSLIARFAKRYKDAHRFVRAGLAMNPTGQGLARLSSGEAQCLAHFGDAAGTRTALATAHEAAASADEADDFAVGLFGFDRARVHYYAGSSLIWLPDPDDARTAEQESTTALELFAAAPAEERFVTDEILAHVYRSTARVLQGDIDGTADALRPVLTIPEQQRVSWHRQRLTRVHDLLGETRHHRSPTARALREEIAAF